MREIEKPTILMLLSVLSIINGVFIAISGILMIYMFIAGFQNLAALLIGALYTAVGGLGTTAGILVYTNSRRGVAVITYFAIASITINVLWLVYCLTSTKRPGWGSIFINIIFSSAILLYLHTSSDVKGYRESIQ